MVLQDVCGTDTNEVGSYGNVALKQGTCIGTRWF